MMKSFKIIQFVIKNKIYILIVISLLGIGFGARWYEQSKMTTQFNNLIDEVKAEAKAEQDVKILKKDSIIELKDRITNTLKLQNEQASKASKYWRREAQRSLNNPNYDIDFITAANILAESKYKPTKSNDTIRQGSNH